MSLVGALTKAGKAGETVKKAAPFYSAVDEAMSNLKRPKGTGIEFLTEVLKQPGVKKAEIADRKLEQAFKAKGKMTKEEAQQVLADNPPPKLKEKVYDEASAIDEGDLREMVSQEMFGKPYSQIRFGSSQHRQISDEVYTRMEMDNGTKFGKYRTPGGENYREILLKLPDDKQRFWAKNGQGVERIFNDPDEASRFAGSSGDARAMDSQTVDRMRNEYHSSHWENEPNVLAHMRVQDRKGANGEKILQVEEIQSDWHQEGRKKGYAKPETKRLKGTVEEQTSEFGFAPEYKVNWEDGTFSGGYGSREQAQARAVEGKSDAVEGTPDAPFKKNWHELAMKRLLNYAADNGYDSIAITPGAEQAKRYDLSKQVGQISYTPSTKNLMAFDHQGNAVVNEANVKPEDLEKYLGVGVTQKLTQAGFEGPTQVLRGTDISVGGEGMMGFYDKMLPDYLNTFGKPYGAQVGQIQAPIKHELEGLRRMAGMAEDPPITLHNFPITPEMREQIKQKGLPLYQQVGIPTAGAASQALQPEEELGLSGGGSVAKLAALAKMRKLKEEMAPRAEAVKALIARDENRYLGDVVPNSLTNAEIQAEMKRMAAKAPMVMKPSALTELRKTVQQEKGDYGARRVERAADEVLNLEKMYTLDALKERFLGDNAKALMTMSPADFEKFATELQGKTSVGPKAAESAKQGDISKYTVPTSEYVKHLERIAMFDSVPYFNLAKEEVGLPLLPYISGHEGRHRSRALAGRGEKSNLIGITPTMDLREGLPRRSQEEFIEAMKKELELSGGLVLPQSEPMMGGRPPIILPDVYAKGGAVKPKVKDTKSGKVRMTTNRDTMFMELSNKKLKRK